MKSLERVQPLSGQVVEEIGQQNSLDILGDEDGHRRFAKHHFFLRVILDQKRAVTQFVQFLRVDFRRFVPDISLWKEKFGRSFDAGVDFVDLVHFSFPASAQPGDHPVFFTDHPAGSQIEF